MLMLAAFGGVCSIGGASARVRSVVGDGVCAHERVSVGLARARCSVAQRARRAGDRVEERVCRNGTMGERGGSFFIYVLQYVSGQLGLVDTRFPGECWNLRGLHKAS